MQITLKYFASIREHLGCDQEVLEVRCTTVAELRHYLCTLNARYRETLGPECAVRAALNHVMVTESALLQPHAEIAFFPPVTGG